MCPLHHDYDPLGQPHMFCSSMGWEESESPLL